MQWVADFTGDSGGQASAFETAQSEPSAAPAFTVHVQARRDIGHRLPMPFQRVPVGVDAPYSLQVASLGSRTGR